MKNDWNNVRPVGCKHWLVLPAVYSDALSYGDQIAHFCAALNKLIQNNNTLPGYIQQMIQDYINGDVIGEVVQNIVSQFILNVKYPPENLTPAVGDGSADDTEAIQGCINYAKNHNGMAVYIPSGAYSVQSLTLPGDVSLFGFDRYTTKLVLRGGATAPMINSTGTGFSIVGLTLDGNAGVQVENINVIDLNSKDVLLRDLIVQNGYQLLTYNGTGGHLQMDNIVFGNAVYRCVYIAGSSIVQAKNLKFTQLSAVSGVDVINISSNGGMYDFISNVSCDTCLSVSGNDNYFSGIVSGATNSYVDTGLRNTIDFKGNTKTEYYAGEVDSTIEGDVGFTTNGTYSENISGDYTSVRNSTEEKIVTDISTEQYNSDKTVKIAKKYSLSADSYDENITHNKTVTADNYSETIAKNKTVTADSSSEKITHNKTVTADSSSENITHNKTVTADNYSETIANDKTVTADSSSENITHNKTVTANNYSENIKTTKQITSTDLILEPTNPLTYKEPQEYDDNFNSIPFKSYSGTEYQVLVGKGPLNLKELNNTLALAVFHAQDTAYPGFFLTDDFLNFNSLNILPNGLGAARDAQLSYINGSFYIACTYYDDVSFSYDLVIYRSENFGNWERFNINLNLTNTRTWAPELYYVNDTLYLYFSHEDTLNDSNTMRIYRATCDNIETLTFSNVLACNGISFPSIDPHLTYFKNTYYMLCKNESTKIIEVYKTTDFLNFTKLSIDLAPPNVEAPTTAVINNVLYLMFDDYLSPPEKHSNNNHGISTMTYDFTGINDNMTPYSATNLYEKRTRNSYWRHGSLLLLNDEMLEKISNYALISVNSAYERMKLYPDHVNLEDLGTLSGTTVTLNVFIPKPYEVYCIFNNPTGVTTPTTAVTIKQIKNDYFRLQDIYIYVETSGSKTLTYPSYKGNATIDISNMKKVIHLREVVDGCFVTVV